MSWLRPLKNTQTCDAKACYDSFCRHLQQSSETITKSTEQDRLPTHDDVLGVVSHLDFMVTLLLVELHNANKICLPSDEVTSPAPCLEFMLSENLFDKLFEWSNKTGRYSNAVRLEQLKLYELLVSHSKHQLLCHEPFLRPLLKLLLSSQGELFPSDVEKRLVILLNQLCVVLMQNVELLDLFFCSSDEHCGTQQGNNNANFIVFSLLIPYLHREGSLGHQARDALLICMALSKKNDNIKTYITKYSSMCPLLVTGLGGLYSRLPSSLVTNSIDWHRITPDDVTEIPELTLFMNSWEFCNAVVQVAHVEIKYQLLDFLFQGFIVPVLGPAILQTNIDSQISAMAYLDLILRSITEPTLIKIFVNFLLDTEKFDGCKILDCLVDRISSSPDSNLCIVTLSLFDTIISLNCEDIMLELLLKFLLPGNHISISCRHKINRIDPTQKYSEFFLDLTPDVMKKSSYVQLKYLKKNTEPSSSPDVSRTIGANWNHYGMFSGDTLYSNYHAYLFDAHHKIAQCKSQIAKWSNDYTYKKYFKQKGHQNDKIVELLKNFLFEFNLPHPSNLIISNESNDKYDSLQSIGESSGYESFKWRPDEELDLNESFDSGRAKISSGQLEPVWKLSSVKDHSISDLDFSDDLFAQGTVTLGTFLSALWGKLQTFTSNGLHVNLILTQVISRIALYPVCLVHSLLLRPDVTITSDIPSFHQILKILKQQIDAELPPIEESLEMIDVARTFLIDREFRQINLRKNPIDKDNPSPVRHNTFTSSNPGQTTRSIYDPFQRNEVKKKSLSKSISSIFGRRGNSAAENSNGVINNASTGLSQIYAFLTGGLTNNTSSSTNITNTQDINIIPMRETTTILGRNTESISPDSLSSISLSLNAIANSNGRSRDLALSAVILDEWLKELAAISQEQSIVMIDSNNTKNL